MRNRRHPPTLSMRGAIPGTLLYLALLACGIAACDDAATPDIPPSITITQPADSQVVRGDVLRILTETSSRCGCNAHVEFWIDGVHRYSHYQPFFYYDWDIRGLSGEHVVRATLVVGDYGEVSDSVRVFMEP
jgi:hypothetical protein